jgi:hypothetical protein
LTARLGDFADRGVRAGPRSSPEIIFTPKLSLMACRHCRRRGVRVTAMSDDGWLFGWCTLTHAVKDGLALPRRGESPAPPPGRRRDR